MTSLPRSLLATAPVAPTRRRLLATTLAGAGLGLAPALLRRAHAAQTVTIASLFGDDKPETRVWQRFAERLDAQLPGAFRFNVVKNAALGGEKEVAESVRLGAIQGSLSTVSALSGWVPESQILDLPFLFRDAEHLARATQGAPGAQLQARFAEQRFVVPAFINYGARHLLTKTPVTRPEQLQGQRIRVIQSPLHTTLWSSYGAIPTGIPITETYNALSSGVVDAMDLTQSAYAGFKLYEVVPHLTTTAHIWAAGVIYFGAPFWNRLSAEQQAAFTTAAQGAARDFDAMIVEDEAASLALARSHGTQVHAIEARADWEAGGRQVWEKLAGGAIDPAMLAAIQAL